MNICITNVDSQPRYVGGIKRVSSILANEWCTMGNSVCFFSLCRQKRRYETIANIPQFFLPDSGDELSEENVNFFCRFIQEHNIDVLYHPHLEERKMSTLCFKVANLTAVKLVTAYHFSPTHTIDIIDSSFFIKTKGGNKLIRYTKDAARFCRWRLYKRERIKADLGSYFTYCLENSDRMVLLSEKFFPDFERIFSTKNSSKIVSIHNPLVLEQDTATPKEKIVLWVGRVEYDTKRVDRMLDIWGEISKRHSDWKCIIIGSGNIEYFEILAKQLGIENLQFTGFCNPKEYYRRGAILCCTSTTEGWGLSLLEAMAHNCIPIAYHSYASLTDIIIDGENGFCIPAFDKKDYIERLEQLMNNPNLRTTLAEKGRKFITRFEKRGIAEQWINLFEEVQAE